LARYRLPHCVAVGGELVAHGGADQVGAVGIEAFLHQQVDLAEIDAAQVDGDLLIGRPGTGDEGLGTGSWHGAILAPSKWMVSTGCPAAMALLRPGLAN